MPYSSFALIRTLHVLTVATTLGTLVALPFLRPRLEGAEDSRWAAAGLEVIARLQRVVVVPGTVLLLLFGLLMVEGPLAQFSFTADGAGWLHIGTTLWMVLAGAVGLMIWARGKLAEAAAAGATGGATVAGLWRWWTTGALTGTLVMIAGVATMAMKLGA